MQDAADGSESDRELAAATAPQVRFGDFSAISMLKILVCFVVLYFGFSSKCFVRKSRRQTPPKGGLAAASLFRRQPAEVALADYKFIVNVQRGEYISCRTAAIAGAVVIIRSLGGWT